MSQFKVGDKVKIRRGNNPYDNHIGEITNRHLGGYLVKVPDRDIMIFLVEDEMEPIPEVGLKELPKKVEVAACPLVDDDAKQLAELRKLWEEKQVRSKYRVPQEDCMQYIHPKEGVVSVMTVENFIKKILKVEMTEEQKLYLLAIIPMQARPADKQDLLVDLGWLKANLTRAGEEQDILQKVITYIKEH